MKFGKALGPWVSEKYLAQNSEPISKTIRASAEQVSAKSPERQEMASSVYHVIEGADVATIVLIAVDIAQCNSALSRETYESKGKDIMYLG
jgi:hypothetical protein